MSSSTGAAAINQCTDAAALVATAVTLREARGMQDLDPFTATVFYRQVTVDQLDGAHRQLLMLRSLQEEVRATVPGLTPPSISSWRSAAADRYAEGLDYLQSRLFMSSDRLTEAAQAIEARIVRMQMQFEAQEAARGGAS